MGREAEGHVVWRGESGAVKALLESDAIHLRGDVRAKLRRDSLQSWRVEGEDLCLSSENKALVLTLGAKEAAAWVRALDKPLPTLAQKLGLSDTVRGAVVTRGPVPEPVLAALAENSAALPEGAGLLVAVLHGPDDLDLARLSALSAGLPLWCIHGKGRGAAIGETVVLQVFREAGWVDTKTCAVDENWTALRFVPRRG